MRRIGARRGGWSDTKTDRLIVSHIVVYLLTRENLPHMEGGRIAADL